MIKTSLPKMSRGRGLFDEMRLASVFDHSGIGGHAAQIGNVCIAHGLQHIYGPAAPCARMAVYKERKVKIFCQGINFADGGKRNIFAAGDMAFLVFLGHAYVNEQRAGRVFIFIDAFIDDFGIEKFGIIRVGYFCYANPKKDEIIMRAQERVCRIDEDFLMLTRITAQLSYDERYLNPYASGHYDNSGLAVIAAESARTLGMYAMGLREEQNTFL